MQIDHHPHHHGEVECKRDGADGKARIHQADAGAAPEMSSEHAQDELRGNAGMHEECAEVAVQCFVLALSVGEGGVHFVVQVVKIERHRHDEREAPCGGETGALVPVRGGARHPDDGRNKHPDEDARREAECGADGTTDAEKKLQPVLHAAHHDDNAAAEEHRRARHLEHHRPEQVLKLDWGEDCERDQQQHRPPAVQRHGQRAAQDQRDVDEGDHEHRPVQHHQLKIITGPQAVKKHHDRADESHAVLHLHHEEVMEREVRVVLRKGRDESVARLLIHRDKHPVIEEGDVDTVVPHETEQRVGRRNDEQCRQQDAHRPPDAPRARCLRKARAGF